MNWLKSRLAEPSTHAALAALVPIANALLPLVPPPASLICAGVFALLGFALPEKPK